MDETANRVTLRGSVDVVTDFFNYAVHSLLYLRGVYPEEEFKKVSKYGTVVLLSTDEKLCAYLDNIVLQLRSWLRQHSVQKLVVVISDSITNKVLERWDFDVFADRDVDEFSSEPTHKKSEKEIKNEIAAIVRQMNSSVTYLPLLPDTCKFDLLIHTDKDIETPNEWEESDPCLITNYDKVKLRSFSTKIHKINTTVQYSVDNDV